jgi:hypothetical protein
MEDGTGDDLFWEGMGENVELWDVQSTALPRGNSYELGPGTMLPRIRVNGRSLIHSTLKASSRGSTLDITELPSRIESQIIPSLPSCETFFLSMSGIPNSASSFCS